MRDARWTLRNPLVSGGLALMGMSLPIAHAVVAYLGVAVPLAAATFLLLAWIVAMGLLCARVAIAQHRLNMQDNRGNV